MPDESCGFASRHTLRLFFFTSSEVTGPIDMICLGIFSFPYISIKLITVEGEVKIINSAFSSSLSNGWNCLGLIDLYE